MSSNSDKNKINAIAFYKMAYEGNPRGAVGLYAGNKYIQHNPLVGDGIGPFITIQSPKDMSYYSKATTVKGTISDSEKNIGKVEDVKSLYWTIPGWDEKPNLVFFNNKGLFTFDVSTKDISGLLLWKSLQWICMVICQKVYLKCRMVKYLLL